MGLLTPINGSDAKRLGSIISAKKNPRKGRLLAAKPWLLSRYRAYGRRSTELYRLRMLNVASQVRSDCEHCFDQETAALAAMKSAIVDNLPAANRFFCPYCCAVKWDTFDHFAPKALFPEFAVLASNLIPACHRCNGKKGDAWTKGGDLLLFNLYFDEWPDDQFLEIDLSYDDGMGATIDFRIREGPLGNASARMKSHFDRLNLLALYREAAASAVGEYRATLRQHSLPTAAAVRAYMLEEANGLREVYGTNHWRAITADVLARTDAFLQAMTA